MPRAWNSYYSDPGLVDFTPEPMLVEATEWLPPARALDLACGAGRNALYLARLGWQVTAVDSAPAALLLLRQRASGLAVDARLADLEAGEFRIAPESFDLVCDFLYLQRSLFPPIRAGVAGGGTFAGSMLLAGAAAQEETFTLQPGELRSEFAGWKILFYSESAGSASRRRTASIVARKA